MIDHIRSSLVEARTALDDLLGNRLCLEGIGSAARILIEVFERKGRVYACGNGGSMCDAMHFAEELTGRYRLDRPALAAMAIGDGSHLSCVANDYGYEHVFSRYVEAHGREGDALLALTTSGTSRNVIRAVEAARSGGLKVIALTGRPNPTLASACDVSLCTPAGIYADRVQELHIKVLHILIELIERHFFPRNYALSGP